MVSDIGSLLVEINKKSSDVHESFRFEVEHPFRSDEGHRTLDDFSEALESYNKLEEILSSDSKLSSIESDVVCAFYSVLAFRIVDSSLNYDKDKFEKAEQILKRAEKISLGTGKNLDKARSKIEWKKASYSSDTLRKSWWGGKSIYHLLRCAFLGEAFNLMGSSVRAQARLHYLGPNLRENKDSLRSELGKLPGQGKELVKEIYEMGRGTAFMVSVIIGLYGIHKDYRLALVGFGVATAIPLSRYWYRKTKTEQLLGYASRIPKIKPVKIKSKLYANL